MTLLIEIAAQAGFAPALFRAALTPDDLEFLQALHGTVRQATPAGLVHWTCGQQPLGALRPELGRVLAQELAASELGTRATGHDRLLWHAAHWSSEDRSACLQAALERLQVQGWVSGWRNELFAFWSDTCEVPDPSHAPLFAVERSGFCPLGLLSHAVHINGFTQDGRLWCGRRALNKATDPGLLDNLTAGGLPLQESIMQCAARELWEEAGLVDASPAALQAAGRVRVSRLLARGWQDEVLHVFNFTLDVGTIPVNQDGEVAEFLCLTAQQVMARMRRGEFTLDAAASLAQGLFQGIETVATGLPIWPVYTKPG